MAVLRGVVADLVGYPKLELPAMVMTGPVANAQSGGDPSGRTWWWRRGRRKRKVAYSRA